MFSPFTRDSRTWSIALEGPNNTPYSGGLFSLKMVFPEDYPAAPPNVSWEEGEREACN